ncbi:MAG: beta-lactamase family protein [Thermoleophilia bacterium]|nr:beta-lactamase family protein [Thermoleophilia bacterium]
MNLLRRLGAPNGSLAIGVGIALAGIAALLLLTTPAQGVERSTVEQQLRGSMLDLIEAAGGPPLAIAVVQRGNERKVQSVGFADLDRINLAHARERMRIASTSKAISGGVALSLVAEGTLSLDDTVGEWLPDQPVAWHAVTLSQLLNHTSGLPDFTATKAFADAVTASPEVAPGPQTLLSYAAGQPLNFPPGSDYRYSNSDNIAVGLIVQAATNADYPTALRTQVFKPLGMGRSQLSPDLAIPKPLIHGYDVGEVPPEHVTNVIAFGGWAWASGGIVSTPGNLNKFIRGYAGGALFGGPTRAAQYTFIPSPTQSPQDPARTRPGWRCSATRPTAARFTATPGRSSATRS